MILILLLLFTAIFSASIPDCNTKTCTSHTDIYNQYNYTNELSKLYLPDTYLPYHTIDPCKQYTNRNEYINTLLNNSIYCSGIWCVNNEYSCKDVGNDCWQVEHIYDKKNSILSNKDYNVNIYGNIVMAYGKWNAQIGQRIWSIVEKEKTDVYGDIMSYAKSNILKCSDTNMKGNFTDMVGIDKETLLIALCISIIINVILISIIICLSCKIYNMRNRHHIMITDNESNGSWNSNGRCNGSCNSNGGSVNQYY